MSVLYLCHTHTEMSIPNANLCFGFISDTKPARGLVRVEFRDETDEGSTEEGGTDKPLVSNWIPISVRKTKYDKETFPYDIGEQVWCVMDEFLEYGIVGGSLCSDEDLPDGAGDDIFRTLFKDGSYEQFDRSSGDRSLFYKGTYKVSTDAGALYRMQDKHIIKNASETWATLLKDILDFLQSAIYTNGSGPATMVDPGSITQLTLLKTRAAALFQA